MKAPAVFELDELDGHATARFVEVPEDQEDAVRAAEVNCPERAIIITG
jgi:ferredoxin